MFHIVNVFRLQIIRLFVIRSLPDEMKKILKSLAEFTGGREKIGSGGKSFDKNVNLLYDNASINNYKWYLISS